MPARRAGQHARETTRRKATSWLAVLGLLVLTGAIVGSIVGFTSAPFLVTEAVLIVGVCAIDRLAVPIINRWDQGAAGEEQVGAILEQLASKGWLVIHDVPVGHGNIDHILVGTGGVLAVEVKSHGGRIAVDRIDERMLNQAWRHAYVLRDITGRRDVQPLLVFSRAYLDQPVAVRKGVTVLPARMLAGHLARRPTALTAGEAVELHARLRAAFTATEARAA